MTMNTKKTLTVVLAVIALVIVGVLALASTKPDDFRYERSTVIAASPAAVFAQVNSPRAVNEWSPWLELDPNVKVAYEGPEQGVGASSTWDGNRKVGKGRATITEVVVGQLVRTRLDFEKPMQGTSTADFTLTRETGGTRVTWSMYGPNTFAGKIMSVFMDCEKMVGEQFEKGLANLKTKVENG